MVLHQCRICNRKFKKRSEFERHLRAHEHAPGHVTGDVMACEVCNYAASCRASLESHLAVEHKFVYVCAVCQVKFPSSIWLRRHLSERHGDGKPNDELFQRSVEKSLFSPGLELSTEELGSRIPSDDAGKVVVAVDGTLGSDIISLDISESRAAEADSNFNPEGCVSATDEKSSGKCLKGLTSTDRVVDDSVDVFKKLGFSLMNQATYDYIGATFGTDECEFCGHLFATQMELQSHVSSNHSGRIC